MAVVILLCVPQSKNSLDTLVNFYHDLYTTTLGGRVPERPELSGLRSESGLDKDAEVGVQACLAGRPHFGWRPRRWPSVPARSEARRATL